MGAFLFLLWVWFRLLAFRLSYRHPARFGRRVTGEVPRRTHTRAKPPWVIHEVLRLKALMPEASCRDIANIFNRRFIEEDASVGKSFVCDKLRQHNLEMLRLRRAIQRRQPQASLPNRVWGLDLTGKTDSAGRCHPILALIDHGTRATLRLVALPDKRAATVLKAIVKAVVRFGRPPVHPHRQ